MFEIRWSSVKNKRLKKIRGTSFEEILRAEIIAGRKHPKIAHQNVILVWHRSYVWVVPYVIENENIFLKTLYPSRKYTKIYMRGEYL